MKKVLVGATLVASVLATTGLVAHREDTPQSPATECTTINPGPGWICAGGGWYPPGMTPPGDEPHAPAAPPAPSTACTTVRPGAGWICAGGGWYPPGMTPPGGEPPAAAAAAAPSTECTTVRPGPAWTCAGGGWYPPGMMPPGGEPPAAAAAAAAPSTACTTVRPGPGWSCAGGGWYPPGMTPPGGEPPSPAAAAAGGRLRVMTWNIHFGHGDPWGQARAIADSGADVVLLQEAHTWDEHMPSTYAERLRQLTGDFWSSVWSGTADQNCAHGCQGSLILSRVPIVNSDSIMLNGTGVSRAAVDVGGVRVNVFNIHLEYYDTSKRSSQLLQFMDWSRQFAGPRLAGGDFNSWWGEWWIQQMETEYSDTWQDVSGHDTDGYTLNGTVRFDYLFRSHDGYGRVSPTRCWVQWTGLSDHGAVLAEYTVR